AHIRNQFVRRDVLIEKLQNIANRRCQDNQIRRLRAGVIDDLQQQGPFEHLRLINTEYLNLRECPFECESYRAADEARSDDRYSLHFEWSLHHRALNRRSNDVELRHELPELRRIQRLRSVA